MVSLENRKLKEKISEKSLPERYDLKNFTTKRWKIRGTPRCICRKGSMTVEAAVILPFLTCLFVFVLFFFRIMQVQLTVQSALENTGRELAFYASFKERGRDEEEGADRTFNYLPLAKSLFTVKIGKDEHIDRFVSGGSIGISLAQSEFEDDEIYLKADYQMKFPVQLLGRRVFYFTQKCRYRKWTGWNSNESGQGEVWVYIAKNGKVYHKTSACTYLKLSIQSVEYNKIEDYRNENGRKYRECNECVEKESRFQKVYITNYGDCYHRDLNCGGIKRTIEMVRLSDTGGKSACSKCWE